MKKFLGLLLTLALICPAVQKENPAVQEKYVALTFDDGPSGRFTRRLLDGLAERNIPATFLLCGYRMAQYPDLAGRIQAEGHEIGLHGYSHRCLASLSRGEIDRELGDSRKLLPEGCEPVFLRPPGGNTSRDVIQAARDSGLALLSWDVDPRDWATDQAGQVTAAVVEKVEDGDVVLLHDMSDSSVQAALDIIDQLREQGYRFLTVSELAKKRGIVPEPGKVYGRFPP